MHKERHFPDYPTGLTVAYEEEVAGEAYFAALAERHRGRAGEALRLLAEMEQVTAEALLPLLARQGIIPRDRGDLFEQGLEDAAADRSTDWRHLILGFRDGYDGYVAEFQALLQLAPDTDRDILGQLLDHEVAIIEFGRAEAEGDAASQRFLTAYLRDARRAEAARASAGASA